MMKDSDFSALTSSKRVRAFPMGKPDKVSVARSTTARGESCARKVGRGCPRPPRPNCGRTAVEVLYLQEGRTATLEEIEKNDPV
jgi:hypothetical protein